jgi:hypothetical protein
MLYEDLMAQLGQGDVDLDKLQIKVDFEEAGCMQTFDNFIMAGSDGGD